MGIILIAAYMVFFTVVVSFFGLISKAFNNRSLKILILLLGIFISVSPVIYLYVRDLNIAKELDEYCSRNDDITVVENLGDKVIGLSTRSGESRLLWRALFNNPDTSLIIDVDRSQLVDEPGRYVFSTMPANSAECLGYYNYIDKQSNRMKSNIRQAFAAFKDTCIGIDLYSDQNVELRIKYQTQYKTIKANSSYVIKERKHSLIDAKTSRELAFSKSPIVKRSFTVFEFSTLFSFDNSCPKNSSSAEYRLLSALLGYKE